MLLIFSLLSLFSCFDDGQLAPLPNFSQIQQYQGWPLNYLNPSLQPQHQQPVFQQFSYQPVPYVLPTSADGTPLDNYGNTIDTNHLFRQNILPIHLNIPNIINGIIRLIVKIFPNFPVLSGITGVPSNAPIDTKLLYQLMSQEQILNAINNKNNMIPELSSAPQIIPMPIVFIAPQPAMPSTPSAYEAVDLKKS